MMTPRENVANLLASRPAERVGLFEHGVWPETMASLPCASGRSWVNGMT